MIPPIRQLQCLSRELQELRQSSLSLSGVYIRIHSDGVPHIERLSFVYRYIIIPLCRLLRLAYSDGYRHQACVKKILDLFIQSRRERSSGYEQFRTELLPLFDWIGEYGSRENFLDRWERWWYGGTEILKDSQFWDVGRKLRPLTKSFFVKACGELRKNRRAFSLNESFVETFRSEVFQHYGDFSRNYSSGKRRHLICKSAGIKISVNPTLLGPELYLRKFVRRGGCKKVFKKLTFIKDKWNLEAYLKPLRVESFSIQRELYAGALLKDAPHVVPVTRVFGKRNSEKTKGLSSPFYSRGNLGDFLQKHPSLTIPARLRLAIQSMKGLAAVHALDLCHLDVKSDNYLVDQKEGEFWIGLSDFGLARKSGAPMLSAGTLPYMAPELLAIENQNTQVSASPSMDIYSAGMMLYEIMNVGKAVPAISERDAFVKFLAEQAKNISSQSGQRTRTLLASANKIIYDMIRPRSWFQRGRPSSQEVLRRLIALR